MSLFLSSGEASGDHLAAGLIRALRAAGFSGDIWGMGAVESRQAGMRVVWHGERMQLLGLTEVISSIPSILKLLGDVVDRVMAERPEAVVVADSPDYHMRLIKRLRNRGYDGRIFYVSPPSVWAWRSGRTKTLRSYADECFPLYGFEHDFLKSRGCSSYWTGSPLLDEIPDKKTAESFIPARFAQDDRVVAFLPGSRSSEVSSLMPILGGCARDLAERGWRPVFSIAPGLDPRVRGRMMETFDRMGVGSYDGPGRGLMAASRCVVGASGTVTVESLLLGCYMVVAYRLNPLSAFVARHVINTKYYAMANLLAGEELFPELLQENCTSEGLTAKALEWLDGDERTHSAAVSVMERTRSRLGNPGAYRHWAERILETV